MATPRPSGNHSSPRFEIPSPPETLPEWARKEGIQWAGLDDFSILVKAEEYTGKQLEVMYPPLPETIWGFHMTRDRRALIFINGQLSPRWRRFALFHELYHFLCHQGGRDLWTGTATPLSSFESQADLFAWAVLLGETPCWDGDAT